MESSFLFIVQAKALLAELASDLSIVSKVLPADLKFLPDRMGNELKTAIFVFNRSINRNA
jgi:hypothetical protein